MCCNRFAEAMVQQRLNSLRWNGARIVTMAAPRKTPQHTPLHACRTTVFFCFFVVALSIFTSKNKINLIAFAGASLSHLMIVVYIVISVTFFFVRLTSFAMHTRYWIWWFHQCSVIFSLRWAHELQAERTPLFFCFSFNFLLKNIYCALLKFVERKFIFSCSFYPRREHPKERRESGVFGYVCKTIFVGFRGVIAFSSGAFYLKNNFR